MISLVNEIRSSLPKIGTRKLYYMLKESLKHIGVGRDKLFSILQANHLLIKPARNYHKTTNSHHRFHKHKNLIQDLTINRPEQVWVSDITYVGNRKNPFYLSLITDAYSKKIMGYDLSDSLAASGSIRALKMALSNRMYKNQLIHHSDRGLQYCCDEYQDILQKHKILVSMTESYDPYANAIAERVNGILKEEFNVAGFNLSLKNMKLLIKDCVDKYNRIRPHYSCYMNTPAQMHKQHRIKIRTYKKISGCEASLTS